MLVQQYSLCVLHNIFIERLNQEEFVIFCNLLLTFEVTPVREERRKDVSKADLT